MRAIPIAPNAQHASHLRSLVRAVDHGCVAAEQDPDLNPAGIARRHRALGRKAVSELAGFKALQLAERAVAENLDLLEKKMVDLPEPPTEIAARTGDSSARAPPEVSN